MKRSERKLSKAFGVAGAALLLLAAAPTAAIADLAPPNVEPCRKLAVGARCFSRGLVPGHCVDDHDEGGLDSNGAPSPDLRCRVDARDPSSATSSPVASSASSSVPTLPSAAPSAAPSVPIAPSASKCSCEIGEHSGAMGGAWLGAAAIALSARARRRRPRGQLYSGRT